jgi:hypothetical protein
MRKDVRFRLWMIGACISVMLAGCAPTQVTVLQQTAAQVPKPDQIRLYNFAVSPDEVSLDRGISIALLVEPCFPEILDEAAPRRAVTETTKRQ